MTATSISSPISTSKRKLSSADIHVPACNSDPLHLLSESSLLVLLQALHRPNCAQGILNINRLPLSQGIYVTSVVICSCCDFSHTLQPSKHFREGTPLNMRAVFAGVVAGYDVTSLNKFLAIIGLPKLPDSFNSVYVEKIYKASKTAVMERLEKNRSAALRANQSGEIAVKFDGTYQTRGFSSKVAVVWISNADTDEILDFVIQSKKCFTCEQYADRSSAPTHECTSNYIGSSCEMERKAAVEMFERSRSFNLTYRTLVSGNSLCNDYIL